MTEKHKGSSQTIIVSLLINMRSKWDTKVLKGDLCILGEIARSDRHLLASPNLEVGHY